MTYSTLYSAPGMHVDPPKRAWAKLSACTIETSQRCEMRGPTAPTSSSSFYIKLLQTIERCGNADDLFLLLLHSVNNHAEVCCRTFQSRSFNVHEEMTVKKNNTTTHYAVVAQREGSDNEAIPVVATAELWESGATEQETTPVSCDSNDLTYATTDLATYLPAQIQILQDSPTTPALFRVQSVVEAPENMKVTRHGPEDEQIVVIERKWSFHWCMVILVLVYNGFMLFMNFLAISAGDWIGVLLLLLFDFFGIIMICACLVAYLNSTFVTVENAASSSSIVVEDRPMFGTKKTFLLSRSSIQEVCSKRNVLIDSESKISVDYDARYIDAHSGEHHVIVGGLPLLNDALFFAQEIQVALGINIVADGQRIV